MFFTNNGSLYYCYSPRSQTFIYASERLILNKIIEENPVSFRDSEVLQLAPRNIAKVSLETIDFKIYTKENIPKSNEKIVLEDKKSSYKINLTSKKSNFK